MDTEMQTHNDHVKMVHHQEKAKKYKAQLLHHKIEAAKAHQNYKDKVSQNVRIYKTVIKLQHQIKRLKWSIMIDNMLQKSTTSSYKHLVKLKILLRVHQSIYVHHADMDFQMERYLPIFGAFAQVH